MAEDFAALWEFSERKFWISLEIRTENLKNSGKFWKFGQNFNIFWKILENSGKFTSVSRNLNLLENSADLEFWGLPHWWAGQRRVQIWRGLSPSCSELVVWVYCIHEIDHELVSPHPQSIDLESRKHEHELSDSIILPPSLEWFF